MMTITVESITPAKTAGKFTVKDASGAFYDAWEVAQSMVAGKTYEIETKAREYNGKTYRTISKATAASNGHVQPQAATPASAPATSALADRGGVSPHVSNWVGQAIQAGIIKDPFDMIAWAQYANLAGQRMNKRPADMAQNEGPRQIANEDEGRF